MANANYQKGVRFERERQHHYQQLGYECYRTAGSHGNYDLIVIDSGRSVVTLVQCKTTADAATAKRLIRAFRAAPPLNPMTNIHQTLEVKVLRKGIESVTL